MQPNPAVGLEGISAPQLRTVLERTRSSSPSGDDAAAFFQCRIDSLSSGSR